jgi:hypothetical protein
LIIVFNKILTESIKEYEWNWDLINLYQVYRQKGIKVFITTDNMDIFDILYTVFKKLAHNVKVVYDVFGVAIKELRSSFSNPKMWRNKTPQRA